MMANSTFWSNAVLVAPGVYEMTDSKGIVYRTYSDGRIGYYRVTP